MVDMLTWSSGWLVVFCILKIMLLCHEPFLVYLYICFFFSLLLRWLYIGDWYMKEKYWWKYYGSTMCRTFFRLLTCFLSYLSWSFFCRSMPWNACLEPFFFCHARKSNVMMVLFSPLLLLLLLLLLLPFLPFLNIINTGTSLRSQLR